MCHYLGLVRAFDLVRLCRVLEPYRHKEVEPYFVPVDVDHVAAHYNLTQEEVDDEPERVMSCAKDFYGVECVINTDGVLGHYSKINPKTRWFRYGVGDRENRYWPLWRACAIRATTALSCLAPSRRRGDFAGI